MNVAVNNVISRLITVFVLLLNNSLLYSQTGPTQFQNPILSGFHPDPSICRVGEDYYLVNSSFEWYPGLPIYHSKDLVNWQLIGYGIHRPNQVVLPEGLPDSRGLYAPTIRYHEGTFYIINTCVKCKGNFYITAKDPAGPWSDPVWLNSRGIDPSLFWEDDGTCYYLGHANITGVRDWPNKNGVWMQKLDLQQEKLIGQPKQLTHGHAKNARWTEGPHLYKMDDQYLLLVAEGGTGFHHAITVHHSDSLWGPYIPNHSNPVFTHRHLGNDYPIHSVGHGDLVQTQFGDWWAVMLGKRLVNGKATLLARETFLTPVQFEQQEGITTPVFNPGQGKLLRSQVRPDLPWSPFDPIPVRDEFDQETLSLKWNFLRSPQEEWWTLEAGRLELKLRPEVIDSLVNPSLIARRLEHHRFRATTSLSFDINGPENEKAGLLLYRNSANYFQMMKYQDQIILVQTHNGKKKEIARVDYPATSVVFQVKVDQLQLRFFYGAEESALKPLGGILDQSILGDENAGGFNGPYVGMYATSEGQPSNATVEYEWFEYEGY